MLLISSIPHAEKTHPSLFVSAKKEGRNWP
jgi:hypothetical protein